jgi:alkylhydroperoxidase family enzyme
LTFRRWQAGRKLDRAGSPVEPALRALIQVRISQINWCAFCVDLNGAAIR